MFAGPNRKKERPAVSEAGARSRLLTHATIVLVFTLVATAVVGFVYMNSQQRAMAELRSQSQQLRLVHLALTDAEADALRYFAGDISALAMHSRRVAILQSKAANVLDELRPIAVDGEEPRPVRELVNELVTNWSMAVAQRSAGDLTAGNALLATGRAGMLLAALSPEMERVLDETDVRLAMHDERLLLGTMMVLALQLGAGGLAILGLIYAFRWSVSEAARRAAAVSQADKSREQVSRLFEMADVLQSASDHGDANAVLTATATELVPGFSGALYVFNNSRDRLVLSTTWGRAENDTLPETISPNWCWALKRGKPHVNRGDGAKLCCGHHSTASGETSLEIPMIARGEIVGLLQLFASGVSALERLEQVTDLGSALADGMSLALANMALREKLRNQALRDPLTGLYNRRYMEDCLQRFVRLAERESRDISLLMVDLDHFKRLNDEHGHAFGDQVLRDTALTLTGSLRETDIVCRYGGEELVIILPDCPLDRAADKAEVLRLRIEELSNTHGAEISASFGVASLPHTSNTVQDLLSAADAALYKAKAAGRNQVHKAPLRTYRAETTTVAVDLVTTVDEMPRAAAE
ncbi:MAG: GGDEF domain-containing protein [Devosia sp.]